MGCYLRYLVDGQKEITLDIIETALQRGDPRYQLEGKDPENERAVLKLGSEIFGELEVNRRGSELMDEELEELFEEIEGAEGDSTEDVKRLIRGCLCMVVVRVLWQGRDTESTLQGIDPLWEWLFSEYSGLLLAEGEGYYDSNGQVLALA